MIIKLWEERLELPEDIAEQIDCLDLYNSVCRDALSKFICQEYLPISLKLIYNWLIQKFVRIQLFKNKTIKQYREAHVDPSQEFWRGSL